MYCIIYDMLTHESESTCGL